jgi:hypothetical protein
VVVSSANHYDAPGGLGETVLEDTTKFNEETEFAGMIEQYGRSKLGNVFLAKVRTLF